MRTKEFLKGFALIILCVGIFACSQDYSSENNDSGKKELVPVSFAMEFAKEITDFRSGEAMNFYDFYYLVYDTETGDLYKKLSFRDFNGMLNDSLPEGNYTIVFAGANPAANLLNNIDGDNIKSVRIPNNYPSIELNEPPAIGTDPNLVTRFNRNTDVFYKRINYVVEKNKSNDSAVILDRIVGKIEIVIEDNIPSEISTIEVGITFPYMYFFTLNADFTKERNHSKSFNVTESDKAAPGYSLFYIAFENIDENQNRYPLSIQITARKSLPAGVVDTGQSIVASKSITNVDILKNKTVRYTGKLFDNILTSDDTESPSSFPFSIDDEWGETIDKEF